MTISPLFKRALAEPTPKRLRDVAVRLAALGSHSGDTRWEAAQLMRQAADEIEALKAAASPEPPAQEVETRLLKFFEWALREGPWEGCSLDGESVQDQAESLGLIVKTKLNPAVHGENPVAEPGDDWFVFSDAVQAFRARAKGNG